MLTKGNVRGYNIKTNNQLSINYARGFGMSFQELA
jgi:hypothetical protein